ncbi:MAG TPA: DUF6049 family protein [Ilumatobacteraceae bacterium]|nr:DUF6049 family protein [Ilumatobacteraceae bacterium]
MLTVIGLISTSFVALLPTAVDAAQNGLQLVAQNFNIAADGSLTATIALPSGLVDTDLSTALFAITVAERVNKREDLAPIISGALSRPDDTVAISPACCPGPQAGQYTFSVPLEASEIRPDALSIPRAGLYPVTIALQRDGRILSTVLTFINRLPAADEGAPDTGPLSVAVAIGTRSTIHLDSEGTTSVDNASTVDEMTSLADTLDALSASKMQATIRIAPAVLGALQILNPTLFARLIASLQAHQVAVEPQWPIDPSSAASAGQNSLYTSWLRDGQRRLAGLGLGPSTITTSTILVDQPIGAAGAVLRYNLGAGLMVTTPQIYDTLAGTISKYSDYTGELIAAQLPNNTTLDVAVVDRIISDLLVHPLATPELTRIYAVANLLALRQGIAILGESPRQRAVVLAMPDLGVPQAAAIGPLSALIAETPGLAAANLDDVAFRTDRLLIDGEEHPVTLPTIDDKTVAARIFRQAKLNNEIDAVASMLPADNDQPKGWRDLANLLPTSALDDDDAASLDTTVRGELDEIRNAVQLPPAYTVNLPGKRSTVRVRFLNNSDVPLQIRVQLSSPSGKLVFNNDPQPVLLPPGVPVNVPIDVEARSNGTSGVSLDVFTPNDVQLGDTVPLKFRVRALGVGNVLTIALFGLALLWWLQHMVSAWRKRRQSRPATLPVS